MPNQVKKKKNGSLFGFSLGTLAPSDSPQD